MVAEGSKGERAMKPMEIQEICQKAGARLWDGEGKERIHSVVTDSRKVEPGSLFIALKGERTDGHGLSGSSPPVLSS